MKILYLIIPYLLHSIIPYYYTLCSEKNTHVSFISPWKMFRFTQTFLPVIKYSVDIKIKYSLLEPTGDIILTSYLQVCE